ncbi:MAG: methyltransferase domain-containing protein [Alphaproteobacteria bacterium]|nr:methyltransferase domain-containing protein [Alphaproteobacteria bacterium]
MRLLRAEARIQAGDAAGAASDAAEAVIIDPRDAVAKAILGLALIDLGAHDDAVACLAEAARSAPNMAAAWRGLAEALTRSGNTEEARAAFAEGVANVPGDLGLRQAAMMAAMRTRNFEHCVALGTGARAAGLVDACILGLLGHALSKLDRHVEASEAYHGAFRLAPEDPYVRHLVSAAGLLPGEVRAPPEYLETVFDGYAGRFEDHLIGLGYRVPGLVRDMLVEDFSTLSGANPPASLGRVLDLGCGTGLVGLMINDLPMIDLTGIDLSAKMLEEARAKGIYATLAHSDILAYLAGSTDQWDTVIGADVLCYFGNLEAVFHALRQRMRRGGRFVFSVEQCAETAPGWRLGSQGRYAHARSFVEAALQAAGFEIDVVREETLRHEAGAAVAGLLIATRKVAADA